MRDINSKFNLKPKDNIKKHSVAKHKKQANKGKKLKNIVPVMPSKVDEKDIIKREKDINERRAREFKQATQIVDETEIDEVELDKMERFTGNVDDYTDEELEKIWEDEISK